MNQYKGTNYKREENSRKAIRRELLAGLRIEGKAFREYRLRQEALPVRIKVI